MAIPEQCIDGHKIARQVVDKALSLAPQDFDEFAVYIERVARKRWGAQWQRYLGASGIGTTKPLMEVWYGRHGVGA